MIDHSKPFVPICMYCQKDVPAVDAQVQKHMKNFNFSHGLCRRHFELMLRQLKKDSSPEEIESFVKQKTEKMPPSNVPDLKAQPFVVKLWSKGIFDPTKIQKITQLIQQKKSQSMTERFQKLAGIRS